MSPDRKVHFSCGWSARAETPLSLASRTISFCRALKELDPAYDQLWPTFDDNMRNPRGTPTIHELSPDKLAEAIDRRGRLQNPDWPAPVGAEGYTFGVVSWVRLGAEGRMGLSVGAGSFEDSQFHGPRNHASLDADPPTTLWRDPERVQSVLELLVRIWEPDWASAYSSVNEAVRFVPWFRWLIVGMPVFSHPFNSFSDAGSPECSVAMWGGMLQSWPWRV